MSRQKKSILSASSPSAPPPPQLTSLVRKSAPMVALYWLENFLLTYWFMREVFPTPESPRMMTLSSTFFLAPPPAEAISQADGSFTHSGASLLAAVLGVGGGWGLGGNQDRSEAVFPPQTVINPVKRTEQRSSEQVLLVSTLTLLPTRL